MTCAAGGTYAFVRALVDEMARSGVAHLCLCPGSRSTPVALTAASHPALRVWTLVDERCAGFFALGIARMSRRPVALLSTSGTAAANFFPAVVESAHGRVPLVVLTADRPPEMRDCGAPQTIDQVRLYGTYAKWFVDVDVAAPDPDLRYARTLASRAVATAAAGPPGPVHLNLPFREPLVPETPLSGGDGSPGAGAGTGGRGGGRPFTALRRGEGAPDPDLVHALADDLRSRPRGVLICGPHDDPEFPPAVARLAAALGYPILADPLSQVRCGPHDRSHVVDSYDALLRVPALADILAPDVIVRLGDLPASKPLLDYMQRHAGRPQVVVDGEGGWRDPLRVAADVVHVRPARLSLAVAAAVDQGVPPGRSGVDERRAERRRSSPSRTTEPETWLGTWQRLGKAARRTIEERLHDVAEPFEGRVFAELATLLPDGAALYVGNSMPARDLDSFFPAGPRRIRFLGNRGASGIDGLVSSALGAAAAGPAPVVLVLGDLAFCHDLGGLLAAKLHRLRATIVLLNNDGGGIFSFLAQAAYREHFEALFGTPTGLDFRHAARLYGAAFARVEDWPAFRTHLAESLAGDGVGIVEVRTARDRNVALHRSVWDAVEASVQRALAAPAPGAAS